MIFIRMFTADVVKGAAIQAFNAVNKSNLGINPSILGIGSTVPNDEVMLLDQVTNKGILFTKLDIKKIIDPNIDISGFETINPDSQQLQELAAEDVDKYNQDANSRLLSVYENNFSSLSSYDMDTLKKYGVFCRVTGFFELDISEVDLFVEGNVLTISVKDGHRLFTGAVEVKTW